MSSTQRLMLVFLGLLVSGCAGPPLTRSQSDQDFGKVLVGVRTPGVTLKWTNNGTKPTDVYGWQVPKAPFFSNTPALAQVPPGGSATLTVSFQPTAVGKAPEQKVRPGTLPTSKKTKLKGEGVWQIVSGTGLSVTGGVAKDVALDFGKKVINQTHTKAITLSNSTNTAMTLTATVHYGKPPFDVQSATITIPKKNATTGAAGTATVTFTFKPTAAVKYTGAVTFKSTDGKLVYGQVLEGEGKQAGSGNGSGSGGND